MANLKVRGFTLIEVVIAMTIVAILTAFALPQYSEYVTRSRRIDARTTLLLATQWMERFRAENRGVYTGAALPAGLNVSPQVGPPMYDLAATDVTATTWTLTATPRAGSPMAADECGAFTVATDGQRTAAGQSSGALYQRCWGR
jgi:type IV pilus assembly protein PilE